MALRLLSLFCALALGVLVAFYGVQALEPGARAWPYMLLHLVLGLLMLGAWWASGSVAQSRLPSLTRLLLGTGVLARLLLLPLQPFTTHDVDRYLWDGAVVVAGEDPYRLAPDHAQLAELRTQWPVASEHAAYRTVYPPLAIALFSFCARAGPTWAPLIWKSLVTLASLATLWGMLLLLRCYGQERRFSLVALNPLLLLEVGVGAHVDIFAGLAVVWALFSWERQRWTWCGVLLAAGTLCKLTPAVVLLPLGARAWGRSKGLVLGWVGTMILGYGTAFLMGLQPLGFLLGFVSQWRFASPAALLLECFLPPQWAVMVLGGLGLLALLLLAGLLRRSVLSLQEGVVGALALLLALSPVAFPWYLLPLASVVALAPHGSLLLWLLLAPFSYEVLDAFDAHGAWAPARWPPLLVGLGWLVGLGIEGRGRFRKVTC